LTAVLLVWRDQPEPAVAVPVVEPVHECRHLGVGLLHALKGAPGELCLYLAVRNSNSL
jgi:hypothetical protein